MRIFTIKASLVHSSYKKRIPGHGWLWSLATGLRGYIDHNGVVGPLLDAYPLTLFLDGAIKWRGGDYGRCVVSTCGFLWLFSFQVS
jgi:hypothetical protein